MHRTITVGLLSVCLAVFVCPQVGKPDIVSIALNKPAAVFAPPHQSCSVQIKKCPKISQHHGKCCGQHNENSPSPSHCCPAPCSALVLMCTVADKTRIPDFDTRTI